MPHENAGPPQVRKLEPISNRSDTSDVLSHATKQAAKSFDDYFIVDIDHTSRRTSSGVRCSSSSRTMSGAR
jgi:hypothetical protein